MSLVIDTIDREATAAALLEVTKQHMRITWATDDAYIQLCIVRAVDLMERHSGALIFSATATWEPVTVGQVSAYQVPIQPISDFVCDLDGVDVSAAYVIRAASPVDPVYLVNKDGMPFDAGMVVTLTAGFAPDKIPPQYLDPILRIAAHLYEHRESVDTTGYASIPQWANDLLMGNWIPRC